MNNKQIIRDALTLHPTGLQIKTKKWPLFKKRFLMNCKHDLMHYTAEELEKWFDIIVKQFTHGSQKYTFFDEFDYTDVLRYADPNWVSVTIQKYVRRFEVEAREKDLIKMATYAYIVWIQDGEKHAGAKRDYHITPAVWNAIVSVTADSVELKNVMNHTYKFICGGKETDLLYIFFYCMKEWIKNNMQKRREHDDDTAIQGS